MDYTRERAPYRRTYNKWKKDYKKKGQDMRWTPGKSQNWKQTGTHLRWASRDYGAKVEKLRSEPGRYNHGKRMKYERKRRNLDANAELFDRWGRQDDQISRWLDE